MAHRIAKPPARIVGSWTVWTRCAFAARRSSSRSASSVKLASLSMAGGIACIAAALRGTAAASRAACRCRACPTGWGRGDSGASRRWPSSRRDRTPSPHRAARQVPEDRRRDTRGAQAATAARSTARSGRRRSAAGTTAAARRRRRRIRATGQAAPRREPARGLQLDRSGRPGRSAGNRCSRALRHRQPPPVPAARRGRCGNRALAAGRRDRRRRRLMPVAALPAPARSASSAATRSVQSRRIASVDPLAQRLCLRLADVEGGAAARDLFRARAVRRCSSRASTTDRRSSAAATARSSAARVRPRAGRARGRAARPARPGRAAGRRRCRAESRRTRSAARRRARRCPWRSPSPRSRCRSCSSKRAVRASV